MIIKNILILQMKLIVIANPIHFDQEIFLLIKMFEQGLAYFHLRKPEYSKNEIEKYIQSIPSIYYNKMVLHSHFELANKYQLKGIHLNSKSSLSEVERETYSHLSYSCHTLEEVAKCEKSYDYIFLSPIFDSISKNGYKSHIDIKKIKPFFKAISSTYPSISPKIGKNKNEIIALGGIDIAQISQAMELGFNGVAVLGSLWCGFLKDRNIEKCLEKFNLLKAECLCPVHTY